MGLGSRGEGVTQSGEREGDGGQSQTQSLGVGGCRESSFDCNPVWNER